MKRLLAALALASCGGEGPAFEASFALTPALAERIARVQIAFVTGSNDCAALRAKCLKQQGRTTAPILGSQEGQPVFAFDFARGSGEQVVEVQVAAGTYAVLVEGLDTTGQLVANACRLNVSLRAGEATEETFALGEYTREPCDARLP